MRPVSVFCALFLAASAAAAAPRWLRLSWTGPSDTTMTVTWTDDGGGNGWVEYGPVGGSAAQVAATSANTGSGDLDWTYSARLEGLQPATEYEYRVQSGGNWSGPSKFRTAPARHTCAPVRFAATGDSRGEEVPWVGYQPSLQWKDIAVSMAQEGPLLALHTGDYVRTGGETDQWAEELDDLPGLSRGVPFFMSLGNHDTGPAYAALFKTPADGTDHVPDYFSLVVGRVLFVQLSTYSYNFDTQLDWLQTVLAAHHDDVDFRVLSFHTPVWSSGAHGSNEEDKARAGRLIPLLDLYKVDLVLNGHDHDYERFHPSKGGVGGQARQVNPLSEDGRRGVPDGTSYIVTGGGGALVNPLFTQREEGSAVGSKNLHYIVGDVRDGKMTLTVRDCGAQLLAPRCEGAIETVELHKPDSPCWPRPPDAGTPVPDAGPVAVDAGPDAGDPADAGPDAGALADAGESPAVDAGPKTTAPSDWGCECGSIGGASLLALALGALARRRRRG